MTLPITQTPGFQAPTAPSILDGNSPNALTAEGLMLYLQTRLEGLDEQINAVFKKQKDIEAVRKALMKIQNELASLNDDTADKKLQGTKNGTESDSSASASTETVSAQSENQSYQSAQEGPLQKPSHPEVELADYEKNIQAAIEEIRAVDPKLAAMLEQDLSKEGQILYCTDGQYFTAEVKATGEYVNNLMKQLESSAQLEMIGLQSTMSARQTAIQLATNLVSALNKGTDAIAANVGR